MSPTTGGHKETPEGCWGFSQGLSERSERNPWAIAKGNLHPERVQGFLAPFQGAARQYSAISRGTQRSRTPG